MYKRILVGVDGSNMSKMALSEAISLAKDSDAMIHIVFVADEYLGYAEGISVDLEQFVAAIRKTGESILANMADFAREAGVKAETKLVEVEQQKDIIPEKIIEEADNWKADLIVIGTHGRRGFSRLLMGSVAESVVQLAKVPVLLVKGSNGDT